MAAPHPRPLATYQLMGRVASPRPADRPTALRLGLLGFGRLAQHYYVPALRGLRGIQSILVADPLESRRALARAALSATTYASAQDLLREGPDAVLVASPPSTHLEIWNEACRHGVPVFMEKPFVLAGELAAADRSPAARRLLMIDFSRRFWPVYAQLAALIRAGAVGAAESAQITLHVDVLAWCSVTSHRLSPDEGGVLYDLGSQTLDLAAHLFGAEPSAIGASIASRRWEGDHVGLDIQFPGGVRVCCDLAYGGRTCERLTVVGREGSLLLADPNMAIHRARGRSPLSAPLGRPMDWLVYGYRGIRRSRSMARYSIRAALAAFLQALRTGEPFAPGFDDAVANSLWLEAASRAAADGSPRKARPLAAEEVAR